MQFVPMALTPDETNALRHAVGADEWIPGTRSHFAADAYLLPIAEALESAGMFTRHGAANGCTMFHATELGCVTAGLSEGETLRALRTRPDQKAADALARRICWREDDFATRSVRPMGCAEGVQP